MIVFIVICIIIAVVLILVAVKNSPMPNDPTTTTSTSTPQQDPAYMLALLEVKRQAEEQGDTATIRAVENMTYKGPIPQLQEDGSYSKIYAKYLRVDIAGINFRRGIGEYVGKFRGYLKPEPTNKHDKNAIAIYERDGKHLGYVPADDTADVRALGMPFPIDVVGEIKECFDYDDDRTFYCGEVLIEVTE